jgi:hypothetical protein
MSVNIIEKLKNDEAFETWTLDEKKQLLEIYYIISTKEDRIFDLIYSYHGCDSWEDICRDYDVNYLKDKASGVEIAIKEINRIKE